jgi:hypothetical protein
VLHKKLKLLRETSTFCSLKYKIYYLDMLLAGQQEIRDEDGHGKGRRHRGHVARHASVWKGEESSAGGAYRKESASG